MGLLTQNAGVTTNQSGDIYRVMVVDDSAFIRGAMTRAVESDPELRVAVSVSNGEQAIRALAREAVDVIILDIEMPVMDGLTALPKLKDIDGAVQIIMASTLTQKNAEISLRAMSLGATDYIPKPSTSNEVMGALDFRTELVEKVKALGALARRSGVREAKSPLPQATGAAPLHTAPRPATTPAPVQQPAGAPAQPGRRAETARPLVTFGPGANREIVLRKEPILRPDIIAIGSSTGGPQALFRVIKEMGKGLPQPIVITQHMPPSFTAILADHIARQCDVPCTEAKEGEVLMAGHYYVAPGDFHMLIEGKAGAPTVHLVKDPPENFCRPAVDPMLRSVASVYGRNILVVILTGMGQDGMKGSDVVVRAGGSVIAQDEATSVVWGMPGAVSLAGLCTAVMPVQDIGGFVRQTATRGRA